MRRKFILLLSIGLIFSSCQENPPIAPDKMKLLLVDVMLLEAGNQVHYNFAGIPSQIWKRDYAQVCKNHGVDTIMFRKAMDWYIAHPEIYEKVTEQVISQLQKSQLVPHKSVP